MNSVDIKSGLLSSIWLYVRYQFIAKLLLAAVVFPVFHISTNALIRDTGRESITSGDFKGVLFSMSGVGLVLITLLLLSVLMVVDIAAFVIAELARLDGKLLPNARSLLATTLRSLPRFWHPGTLALLAYIGLVVPLVGLGPAINELSWLKIPNFVMDVINNNNLYYALYAAALVVLSAIAFMCSLTIQIMYAENLNPWKAMVASTRFVRTHWKLTALVLLRGVVTLLLVAALSVIVFTAIPITVSLVLPTTLTSIRFTVLLSAISVAASIGFLLFLVAPMQLRNLTRMYGATSGAARKDPQYDERVRQEDRQARMPLLYSSVLAVVGIIALAAISAFNFDQLFKNDQTISVVTHRGGGDLDAENSREGIEAAINVGAQWSEIDIQRTKDGHYILNHDATFKRVAGVNKTAQEMTLEEIQQIRINNAFTEGAPARPVPTIEQAMDTAAGKIGLFIELKGDTADTQMVDDMAAMIKQRGLESSMALLSLDYQLISYAEQTYPELTTGYLYYFAVGDSTQLNADYFIMEEGVASDSTVQTLQEAGKKVIVWTVNTPESIKRFTGSQVNGIITDRPQEVIKGISEKAARSDIDRIYDAVFGDTQ